MKKTYLAAVEIAPDSDVGVWFPDFPGCVTAGGSVEEALTNAQAALQFHIEGMVEDGEAIPAPSDYGSIRAPEGGSHVMLAVVTVTLPTRTKRINITIDEGLLALINERTSNVSAFLSEAAREKLKAG